MKTHDNTILKRKRYFVSRRVYNREEEQITLFDCLNVRMDGLLFYVEDIFRTHSVLVKILIGTSEGIFVV